MKTLLFLLLLLALPWKVVGAHDEHFTHSHSDPVNQRWHKMRSIVGPILDTIHPEAIRKSWFDAMRQTLLDSLYRASLKVDTVRIKHCDSVVFIYDTIPPEPRVRTYIREIVPLDSVPIMECETGWQLIKVTNRPVMGFYLDGVLGFAQDSTFAKNTICDTTGWRITKEQITETRVE